MHFLASAVAWEATVVNMGHVLRKARRYPEAIKQYHSALALAPSQAGTYAALGFTYHLQARHFQLEFSIFREYGLLVG